MNFYILFFIGIFLGIFNSLAIKITIRFYLKTKKIQLIFFSFFLRMIVICAVFYIFLNQNWRNAVIMLIGLTISKIFYIIYNKLVSIKK